MRIAVVSDIHANMDALAAVLADIDRQGADRIVSLGDNIGYGPEPEEVMAALARHRIPSIMGNHERALVDPVFFRGFHPEAQKALEINRVLLSGQSLARIEKFPLFRVVAGARLVHGIPPDLPDRYVHKESLAALGHIMAAQAESLTFVGHTHRLALYESGPGGVSVKKIFKPRVSLAKSARYIINSGSVGQPRASSKKAAYLIWDSEGHCIEPRRVAYDAGRTVRLMAACGIPELYRDLLCEDDGGLRL